jgi:hypothetical protein
MRRRSSILHDAYHEAGHVVAALALGMEISSVWIVTEGRDDLGGRTQTRAHWDPGSGFQPLPDHERDVVHLAGDAAGQRHERTRLGHDPYTSLDQWHLLSVLDDLGDDEARPLWAEAVALIEEHWLDIERLASVLATRRCLYGLTPETWRETIALPEAVPA